MKEKKSVEVILGGQRLSLRTEADGEVIRKAADLVNEKLTTILPKGEILSQQALLVLAMNLADEVIRTRQQNQDFRATVKERSEAILHKLENHFQL